MVANKPVVVLLTCFGLLLAGCARSSEAKADAGASQFEGAVTAAPALASLSTDRAVAKAAVPPKTELAPSRAVVRRAELGIRVERVEVAEKRVQQQTVELGGYLDSAESSDLASSHPTMDLTVRVPTGRFEEALARYEALGTRLSKSISTEDVTGQLVDMDARLKTLSAQESVYRDLLQKQQRVADIVSLQDRLTDVRTQIETIAGQRKALNGLATLSTIRIHLEQDRAVASPASDPGWLAQTWADSTSTLAHLLRVGFQDLIWFAVFLPIWLPIVFVLRRLRRLGDPTGRSPEIRPSDMA